MRIVGGKYKGRILKEFNYDNIRPTADNVREALFNILGSRVDGCCFLDLYAGTGAVGIEAISRGAKKVVFNDLSRDSLSLVKENLKKLGEENSFEIFNGDGLTFLKTSVKKFDFIFIDPPYKEALQEKTVEYAERVLADDGVIILEDEKPFEKDFDTLIKYDERKYGRVCLSFFKKAIPEKKSCIFAGTFDPVTKGHLWVIKECRKRFEKVFVCIGVNNEKTPTFPLDKRLEALRAELDGMGVIIDSYDGLTVDYMKENGIDVAVRGIRNDRDYKYEKKMLDFNKSVYSDYRSLFLYPPKHVCDISSTAVRKGIADGKDLSKMLSENTERIVKGK